LRQMAQADTGRLLVMDQGKLVGLVTRSAIAHFIMLRSELGFTPPAGTKPAATPESKAA
jgi:CBS domain-containing protein